jgi:two-component system, OmpR family, sensor kinase
MHRFESRQRVTIRLALALVVLLCAGAWLTMQRVESELRDDIDDQLRADAAEVTGVLETLDAPMVSQISDYMSAAGFDMSHDENVLVLRDPARDTITLGADVEDPETVPDVFDTPIAELRGRAGEPFTVDAADGSDDAFRVETVALEDGRVALAARPLDGVNDVMRILHKTFLIGTILSVFALGLLVWAISRQALRPLEEVVETAHAIGAGNLDTRVQVASTAPDVARLRNALNKMLGRLQAAFDQQQRTEARLRQFVSNASHELRTPLAAILGHAELYHEGMARTPAEVERAMSHITAEGTRMQSLVEDLLLLARLDEGRPLARDAVDLAGVVHAAAAAVATIDGDHPVVVDTEPVDVVGDAQALRQIVDNLLINVVVHTPPGTTAQVRLRPAAGTNGDARGARLVISDDGPGMEAVTAEHVFERFVRVEPSRVRPPGTPGGSGLGLAIVDELVRAQGGTVTLDTAPGAGATFTVTLPGDGAPDVSAT